VNGSDYVKKAVELADGWRLDGNGVWPPRPLPGAPFQEATKVQVTLDALAAQLVRQVDATVYSCQVGRGMAQCYNSIQQGPDRTMNTIKAIVDSGVLDGQ